MSTIIFRASDNATALELVERRFGGDALILSTVYIDGRVEITATDAAPLPANSDTGAPRASRRRVDVMLDAPVALTPPDPAPQSADAALPRFLRQPPHSPFAAALEAARQAPVPQDPAPRNDPALLRADLLEAARIVLVGPCGAGKTQVALQLALLRRSRKPDAVPGFVFCGTGSRADGAVLAQKSHLLGMKTVFQPPADIAAPSAEASEIVLLSGRVPDAALQARGLSGAHGTRTLLVLPDGLRPERITRLGAQWREITTSVTIGHVAAADRAEAEATLSSGQSSGPALDLLWLSDPDALVDGLCPVKPDAPAQPVGPLPGAAAAAPVVFRRHHKSEARP